MNDQPLRETASRLLAKEGFCPDFELELLKGGKNNQVYKVASDGASALLKVYFRHPEDKRNRCDTEYSFVSFAWESGIRCIPRPLRFDSESGLALYELIDGCRLSGADVTLAAVQEAIEFFANLNSHRSDQAALQLKPGSEACFSIASHIQCTDGRVRRLLEAADDSDMDAEAKGFVKSRLSPSWGKVRESVDKRCSQWKVRTDSEISPERRRLSPSDFGFHNALKRPDGKLCFLDFEYAGWDDVAKTVCDFFQQPAVPVPEQYFKEFLSGVLADFEDRELEEKRIVALTPVYQVKWCCILLNDFLPVGETRRKFSLGEHDDKQRRSEQLELAKRQLRTIVEEAII